MKCCYFLCILLLAASASAGSGWAWTGEYTGERPGAEAGSVDAFTTPDGRYMELDWEKLIPPDWNPGEVFDELRLDRMDDNDPRVEAAMRKFKELWDAAPTNPALQGKLVKISGFVAPLDFTDKAELQEFLLVPYFGACIHVPPPPANQIILVTLKKPHKGIRSMETVSIYGKFAVEKTDTDMGRAGYSMKADAVEKYVEKTNR